MSEAASSDQASLLLAGSLVLYPVVGPPVAFNLPSNVPFSVA